MEAATTPRKKSMGLQRFFATRRGSLTVAIVAALLAAAGLVAYLAHYKTEVRGGTVPAQVLVADRLIPRGTSGDAIATGRFFRVMTLTADDIRPQALEDATNLAGQVTARDIAPGQQLTADAFSDGGDPLRGQLAEEQRGLAIPVDAAHGLVGDVRPGDHVDVLASFPSADGGVLKTLAQNTLVLKSASDKPDDVSEEKSLILRLTDAQAARVAFAVDNGKVWVTLRPPAGDAQNGPQLVTRSAIVGGR